MKIIVDAMGGDNAPGEIVEGAIRAGRDFEVGIILVGEAEKLRPLLKGREDAKNVEIFHAPEEITCSDDPVSAVKAKKNSSMVQGLKLLKSGGGDGFVSAGSTGALISGASLYVKRIPGVRRMALAPLLPVEGGHTLLMDSGANMDCKADYLAQFAIMGSIYMEKVRGVKNPRVGLLNVGVEEGKGDALTKEAYGLLKEAPVNFVGNIEAREVLFHATDVLVCDGFAGNILLKGLEGAMKLFSGRVKRIFTKNVITKLAGAMVSGGLREFKNSLTYDETGGAPMLGADGTVIKSHGNATSVDIYHAVRQAIAFSKNGVNEAIRENTQKPKNN